MLLQLNAVLTISSLIYLENYSMQYIAVCSVWQPRSWAESALWCYIQCIPLFVCRINKISHDI